MEREQKAETRQSMVSVRMEGRIGGVLDSRKSRKRKGWLQLTELQGNEKTRRWMGLDGFAGEETTTRGHGRQGAGDKTEKEGKTGRGGDEERDEDGRTNNVRRAG